MYLPLHGCVALHPNELWKHSVVEAAADRSQGSHSDQSTYDAWNWTDLNWTENANFVTNAHRGDLSTVNVRPWCSRHTCSVHQLIGYWILPQFDPIMRPQTLLEVEIPSPLYAKEKHRCFLELMVAVIASPLSMDEVEVMVVRMVQCLNKRYA